MSIQKYNNFSIMLDKVLIDERLTEKEKLIYLINFRIKSYNTKLELSQDIIKKSFNFSNQTYLNALNNLEKYNYIKTHKHKRNKNKSNAVVRSIEICDISNNINLFDYINKKLDENKITNFRFYTTEYLAIKNLQESETDEQIHQSIKNIIKKNGGKVDD